MYFVHISLQIYGLLLERQGVSALFLTLGGVRALILCNFDFYNEKET